MSHALSSSTALRPRALTHRGTVAASGLWFDFALGGEWQARRRVLAAWESGARVSEIAGGYLLRFAAPRPYRADLAPATLLVEREGWLLAAPLSASEWNDFRALIAPGAAAATSQSPADRAAPSVTAANASATSEARAKASGGEAALLLVRGGALLIECAARPVDVASWLDVSGWEGAQPSPLGAAEAPALTMATVAPEARVALDVPTSPELRQFLARMRGEESEARPDWRQRWARLWARESPQTRPSRASGGDIAVRRSLLGRLFQFRFGARGASSTLGAGEQWSGEFGLLARPALIFAGLVLLAGLILGRGTSVAWPVLLRGLALVALSAWALLLLARCWPSPAPGTPRAMANQRRAAMPGAATGRAAWGVAFDLVVLLGFCGAFWWALATNQAGFALVMGISALRLAIRAHQARRRLDPGAAQQAAPASGASPALGGAGLAASWGALWRWLWRRGASERASEGASRAASEPRGRAINFWLWRTELARLFGARQARYMMKMLQMFERGDLDNALRHAVPFSAFGSGNSAPSLGVPRPRQALDFLGTRGVGGTSLPLPAHIKERLTQHYRAAHERLAAQNRVDEAAFVLAELLDSPLEAVQFLEGHQRWRPAAQLSEARHLDAGLTTRLWWLAGERERAIAIARRSGAFADAVTRLERGDAAQRHAAHSLRLLWAQHLAQKGDFAGAVEAAWPVAQQTEGVRGVIGAWIERGMEGEGVAPARMLGRQAHLLADLRPQNLEIWRERTRELLENGAEEGIGARLVFATVLSAAPPHPLARAAARRAARALSRDAARFPAWSAAAQSALGSLLDYAADSALRADWTKAALPAPAPRLDARTEPLELRWDAEDAGALSIEEAALLPSGRALLALGESGARLLDGDGKTVAHFDQPCHRLALSDNGERAIGIARRGGAAAQLAPNSEALAEFVGQMGQRELARRTGLSRLCRFDLTRRRAETWDEVAELGAFAPDFSPNGWLAASGDALLLLDESAPAPVALWSSGAAGQVLRLARSQSSVAVLTQWHEAARGWGSGPNSRLEVWRFDLPSLTLRERRLVPLEMAASGVPFVAPDGWLLCVTPSLGAPAAPGIAAGASVTKHLEAQTALLALPPGETATQIERAGTWLAALSLQNEDALLRLWTWKESSPVLRAQIALGAARRARFRLSEAQLTLADARGRWLALDLTSGQVLRDARLF